MELQAYLEEFARRDWQSAEEGTIRFAMVGLGWWTKEHAIPATEDSALCETTVVVSSDAEEAGTLVDEHRTAERALTYDEFHEGEAADAYDAAYVATPNALHLPYVETAAGLGKHVLCEKPMEASVERAEAMVEACEDAGVTLMVGYRMQTEPAIRRARDLVRAGLLGEPAHVQSHMTQRLLAMNPDPDQWRLDPERAGPGASVTDLGIYAINTARFVLDADPVAVHATMHSAEEAFDAVPDERASFLLELDDGASAACSASQNAVDDGRFAVLGTVGQVALDPAFFADDRRTLTVQRGGTAAEFAFETVDQMTEEFDYFADRVLTDRDVHPDGRHGLTDVRTIEAIYEAAGRGERVAVPG